MSTQARRWHVICDEFSWQGWMREGATRIEGPELAGNEWERIASSAPESDFLLIEAVWENFLGFDRLTELQRILMSFRREGIPVIFWNKEDPAQFDFFLPLALHCSAVFTTDEACCPKYRSAGFAGPVEVLTFPAHPDLHKVYGPRDLEKRVLFAGSPWFEHPDRHASYHYFLKPAVSLGCVDIYARRTFLTGKEHWPEEVHQYIVGELKYLDLLKTCSRYTLGLSMSCCPYSRTMYARRIVELPLAGLLPISDNSRAVRELFPEIPVSAYAQQTRELIQYFLHADNEREDRLAALQKRILTHHTYSHALHQLYEMRQHCV